MPVAAAVIASAVITADARSPAGNADETSTAIGAQTKARTQAGLSRAGDQNGQGANDAPTKSDPPSDGAKGTQPGPSAAHGAGNDTAAPASNDASAQQSAADGAPVPPQQTDTAAQPTAFQPTADLAAARANAAGGTSSDGTVASSERAANGATKTATGDLSNLGLAAANVTTTQSTTPTTGTAPAAVSIAGLPVAIASRALAGSSQFDIRLDPAELGRIDVRLDVNSNGQVTSHITADRPDTLSLLQSQQPQIERALEQAGLKTADNGLQFSLRDQSFSGQNNNGGGGSHANTPQYVIPDASLPPVQTTQIYSRSALRAGIDIRV